MSHYKNDKEFSIDDKIEYESKIQKTNIDTIVLTGTISKDYFKIKEKLYIKNFITKKVYANLYVSNDSYHVLDDIIEKKWTITDETKVILGFKCFKAIEKIGENLIKEAWFTPEIPISDGPANEYGLPGLILSFKMNNYIEILAYQVDLQPNLQTTNFQIPENINTITFKELGEKVNLKNSSNKNEILKSNEGEKIILKNN